MVWCFTLRKCGNEALYDHMVKYFISILAHELLTLHKKPNETLTFEKLPYNIWLNNFK